MRDPRRHKEASLSLEIFPKKHGTATTATTATAADTTLASIIRCIYVLGFS